MLPADQCFKACKTSGCQIDNGLVDEMYLATLQRPTQATLGGQFVICRTHIGVERLHGIALPLGQAQSEVCFAEKHFAAVVMWFADCEADTGCWENFPPGHFKWLRNSFAHKLGNFGGSGFVRPSGDQHGERIAVDARQSVFRGNQCLEALRQCREHGVCRGVAETFIYGFEPVQIRQNKRDTLVTSLGAQAGAMQPVCEERAVGQTGQRIVQGFAHQTCLLFAALGDILYGADASTRGAIVACKAGGAEFQPSTALGRVRMGEAHLQGERRIATLDIFIEHLRDIAAVIAVNAGHPGFKATTQGPGHEAQMSLKGRVHIERAGGDIEVPHSFA